MHRVQAFKFRFVFPESFSA